MICICLPNTSFLVSRSVAEAYIMVKVFSNLRAHYYFRLGYRLSVSHHNVPHKCSFICLPNTSQFQLSCPCVDRLGGGMVYKNVPIFLFAKTVKEEEGFFSDPWVASLAPFRLFPHGRK